jgi:hypothetical protein
VRSQVSGSKEDEWEEGPVSTLGSLGGVGSPVVNSVWTVSERANKSWWSLGNIWESEDGGVLAHTGTGEVSLNSSKSINVEVGDVGGILQSVV